jgi:hypothetical protein
VILDLGNGGERNLYDLSVGALNLNAGSREGLGGFHAANRAANAPAINGDDFHVVFAIQWLQGRERFCYLHVNFLPAQICLLRGRKSTDPLRMQPENSIWRIETCACILRITPKQVSAYDAEL